MAAMSLEQYYIHHDIAQAKYFLPSVFTSSSLLQLEMDSLFKQSWLLVPNPEHTIENISDRVKIRGTYYPVDLLDEPLMLWRDYKENKLHCYSNVCTHAWYSLINGAGRSAQIQCEQHGRVFHCSGRCVSHKGFDKNQLGPEVNLKEFGLGEWEQFLFVNFIANSDKPFQNIVEEMVPIFENIPLKEFPRIPHTQENRIVNGNWKQYVMNFLDSFHLAFIHPGPGGLVDMLDMPTYTTECGKNILLQWAYTKNPEYGIPVDLVPDRLKHEEKRIFALYCFVFPNMAFNLYPWGLGAYMWMPTDDPLKTNYYWYQYMLDEEKFQKRNEIWLAQMVNDEDVDAMNRASVGLKSSFIERGQFAVDREGGPHWFSQLLYSTMRENIIE